jgi:glutathione S-transferase
MKIYGHPLSSCTRKVWITLHEKGHTAELVQVDLLGGEHRRPAHLAKHPFGKIPVLEHDRFRVYESRAIVRYLDAVLEGPRLSPAGPEARARMEQWMSVDQSYVSPHISALVREHIVKKMIGETADASVVRQARAELEQALDPIDAALRESTHLAGEDFSLADVSLMPYVASLGLLGCEDLLSGRPGLAAWWARAQARPSWRATLQLA